MKRQLPRHERGGAGGMLSSGSKSIQIGIGIAGISIAIAIPISISMVWRTITLYSAEFRIIRISPSN
ncbi:MAG TPA: hypothetical protein VLT88_04045 [Desulfosarcina sp.]|nr:hypothetical protein [Desulfosarcina sp.]